ncbi:hypothetical protein PQR66_37830 [Paraburkholderia agricolaris]|uniref:SMP-30/Gluconolaconase/LRE-like region-containing protein n=1 Tax=Paraburkholderia agricolaris TaxID=2152888 RepID=A0ABW9A2C6_9BURK
MKPNFLNWTTARRISVTFVLGLIFGVADPAIAKTPSDTAPPSCNPVGAISPVCGVHGPEDIELTPDARHLVISELPEHFDHPARGLMLMDLTTDHVAPLSISSKFEVGWGDPTCTAPPAQIGSHGIHLSRRPDGRLELFVVNHAQRESIEALELIRDGAGYRAAWHGCVVNPDGLMNGVSATYDGGFVATVMLDKATAARKDVLDVMASGADTGYLVEWHPGAGLVRLPNSEAPMNNGIQILSSNPRFIYFNAWTGEQVRKYDRQTQRVTAFADLTFHPDNLRVRTDGKLIVTGIDELHSWKACTLARSAFCRTGFSAVTLDPDTMATALLFHGEPGVLAGASVGVQTGNTLYVGSFMGDRLLKIGLSTYH